MYPRGGASVCRGQQGCDVCAALPMPTTTHHRRRFALSPKVQTTKELTKGTRGGCQTRLSDLYLTPLSGEIPCANIAMRLAGKLASSYVPYKYPSYYLSLT